MKNFKFPPITATHSSNRLHSSRFPRFFCVNNKVTPSIMSDQGNIPSGSKSESCSSTTTTTSNTVAKEKEKPDKRRPIPEPPEKPLPGDCCGSGCVRCVWDIYYEELEEYNNLLKTIVVDFAASWCGPCRIMSPYFAELAKSMPSAIFLKVDVDELKSVAEDYEAEEMPTFMLIKEGKAVEIVIGAKKEELQQTIAKHLNAS